ncbi:sulfurtransferase complex subunit TusB [Buchnera aphidicola (Aphis craccivora)]|uniref:Protein TusB n=1 Tax=Buchnera aphidicola (Aphis craccivora) TaxID=466616 RepID=A0A4D6XSI5_9GAMM|nr:sulfurtransferase complex subunit TusB [Buchnera aphidicola]QCI16751.1 sulfurtransferase complex subunit TusB [Buchnera aphidicola (Aphis craccivora)]QLL40883.1 sulfurtransferase complex subunit TusB [Buchnera aphidicola (Aphis craccivore)]WAI17725.1 MAG: sulfurtransferase complex subunit TusB [Buchnera aphidicola (Aphis craccivora)]
MLHTLIQSPYKTNIPLLISMLKKQDDFLALQDGVLIALTNNFFLDSIIFSSANLYLIKDDVYARGIINNISSDFTLISYFHFVSLTLKNKTQMTW